MKFNRNRYTALVTKEDLNYIEDYLSEYITLYEKKDLVQDDNFYIIYFELIEEASINDLSYLFDIYALHEESSRTIIINKSKEEEVRRIFYWSSATSVLFSELLTPTEKIEIIQNSLNEEKEDIEIMIDMDKDKCLNLNDVYLDINTCGTSKGLFQDKYTKAKCILDKKEPESIFYTYYINTHLDLYYISVCEGLDINEQDEDILEKYNQQQYDF